MKVVVMMVVLMVVMMVMMGTRDFLRKSVVLFMAMVVSWEMETCVDD